MENWIILAITLFYILTVSHSEPGVYDLIGAGNNAEVSDCGPQSCVSDNDCSWQQCTPGGITGKCRPDTCGKRCVCMSRSTVDDYSVADYRRFVTQTLEQGLEEDKGAGCDILKLDPFSKEIMKFDNTSRYRSIDCGAKDWVKCYLFTCQLEPFILRIQKDITCHYRDIIYQDDHRYTFGPVTVLNGNKKYKIEKSDHVTVKCMGFTDFKGYVTPEIWYGQGAGFRPVAVNPSPPGRDINYNVLIFLFDTASKNGFMRKMPKSYSFIQNEMNATILNGYNVVGDGTVMTLFPILTGKTILELPESRKSLPGTHYFDTEDFVFSKFKKDGYRTAYFEDSPGTLQLRYNGFLQQPADHYPRPFFSALPKGVSGYCVGDTPRYQFMINLTDQFFRLDGKKYSFTLISDISHDDFNMITVADNAFVKFLKELLDRGDLKDTLTIIMGDHGVRYQSVVGTLQGKLEMRLPLMAIRLPDELITQRPNAQIALQKNVDVLTTPHDIYATVLDVVDMKQHWNNYKIKGADLSRGLTLLEPVSKNRSCSEAGIEPHWCTCIKWQAVNQSDPIYDLVSNALVKKLNEITKLLQSKCARRTLTSISSVLKKGPQKKVLQFDQPVHTAYVGKFTKKPKTDKELYEVQITVHPGSSSFAAAVTHSIKENKFVISPTEISRINAYNDEPKCIEKIYPHLKPFCYCI